MEYIWHGFSGESFDFEGREAYIVFPKNGGNGRIALKTEYWDAFPNAEISLLEHGFTVAFNSNRDRWGSPESLECKARFVRHIAEKYSLDPRCALVGMSCGGLIAIKFAAEYPELTAAMYLDAPVIDFLSCPCGLGKPCPCGKGVMLWDDGSVTRELLDALNMKSVSELLVYRGHPYDKLPEVIKSRIPAILVCGDSDKTVPYSENGAYVVKAYENTGIPFEVYLKVGCDHHPHGFDDPAPIVSFIVKNVK